MALVYQLGKNTRIVPLVGGVLPVNTPPLAQVRIYFGPGNSSADPDAADGVCIAFDENDAVYTHADLKNFLGMWVEVLPAGPGVVIRRAPLPLVLEAPPVHYH